MEFVVSALDYLLGIPVLGWGEQIGFVYKGVFFLLALLIFTAYILLADRKIWAAVQVRRPLSATPHRRWRNYERHLGPLLDALGPLADQNGASGGSSSTPGQGSAGSRSEGST